MENFKTYLRHLLLTEGVSMTDLADRMKVSRQTLYKSLDSDLRLSTLNHIADALGYEVVFVRREK